jgi:hypothetical protein
VGAHCEGFAGRGCQRTIYIRVGMSSHCPCIETLFESILRTHYSLAHPERGMTRHNVLGIARDSYKSIRLCVATQDVVDCGWILFPCVSSAEVSSVLDCRRDILGLVGYEGTEQEAVMRQIKTFIVRVARRSIVDMVRLGNIEELATMWYKKEVE